MNQPSKQNAIDDLSIYDRSSKKTGGAGGLWVALLLSAAVLAGSVVVLDYALENRSAEVDSNSAVVTAPPSSVHGVISRAPLVAVERETSNDAVADEPVGEIETSDIELVNAVNRTTQPDPVDDPVPLPGLSEPSTEPPEPLQNAEAEQASDSANAGPETADELFGNIEQSSEEVTVYLPVQHADEAGSAELEQATREEVERLYSAPSLKPRDELLAPAKKAQAADKPAAKRPVPQRRKVTRLPPPDARCTISQRELARVSSELSLIGPEEPAHAYMSEQEAYYRGQVSLYCR